MELTRAPARTLKFKNYPSHLYSLSLKKAQRGQKPQAAKPLKGFSGAGVLEIVENFTGGTYRAVYTVRFQKVVYVLHCFQKKSKHGIKTPQQDINLIKQRLKMAEEDYKTNQR